MADWMDVLRQARWASRDRPDGCLEMDLVGMPRQARQLPRDGLDGCAVMDQTCRNGLDMPQWTGRAATDQTCHNGLDGPDHAIESVESEHCRHSFPPKPPTQQHSPPFRI